MQCPECDVAVEEGARFCHRCGTALSGGGADSAPVADASREGEDEPRAPQDGTTRDHAPEQAHDHAPEDLETSVLATPPPPGGERRQCPSCGAPNSPRRELCGRCGADLDTGVSPPRPTEEQPSAQGPRSPESDRRRPSPWLVVAGLALVAVLVAAGLTLAGLGPLADAGSAPETTFTSEVYGDEPTPLLLSDIATSSTLAPAGGETYDATLMVDDDPTTAWNSDGSQNEDGVGETIDLFLDEPAWVQRLVVDNGYQRDSDTYADNARIRRALLRLDGGEQVTIRLEDLGLQRQAIELPEPVLTTTVRLEVTEAFPGDTYPDLAVSDLQLHGWTAMGEDAEVARERAEADRAAPPTR